MKLFISHSPAALLGKITDYPRKFYKSIKDQKNIGGRVVVKCIGNSQEEAEKIAEHVCKSVNGDYCIQFLEWCSKNNYRYDFDYSGYRNTFRGDVFTAEELYKEFTKHLKQA